MGSSASKQAEAKSGVVCIDCDKKSQKDLPFDDSSSASAGMACEKVYAKVVACMDKHEGQIGPCASEWDEFKKCHAKNART
mmetsp:Transcript_16228/g.34297  ORF Transcript_16228/g.34297 Transcript_16228/m.34297 type:complete len:81 (-) Transcript_16228:315-557(-)